MCVFPGLGNYPGAATSSCSLCASSNEQQQPARRVTTADNPVKPQKSQPPFPAAHSLPGLTRQAGWDKIVVSVQCTRVMDYIYKWNHAHFRLTFSFFLLNHIQEKDTESGNVLVWFLNIGTTPEIGLTLLQSRMEASFGPTFAAVAAGAKGEAQITSPTTWCFYLLPPGPINDNYDSCLFQQKHPALINNIEELHHPPAPWPTLLGMMMMEWYSSHSLVFFFFFFLVVMCILICEKGDPNLRSNCSESES